MYAIVQDFVKSQFKKVIYKPKSIIWNAKTVKAKTKNREPIQSMKS